MNALKPIAAGENVASVLTPPGAAAIAVVRLVGERVPSFLATYFSSAAADGRCVHGELRDEAGNVLDDPVVVCSANGTIADLNVHGGPWVLQSVLNLAERHGFALMDAGPEARVTDGVDRLQQEMLEHLPKARTELALSMLLAQPKVWGGLKSRLRSEPPADRVRELETLLADPSLMNLLRMPRVAIVGAPNVGKSTLANQLFAQARSITADLPGTTRDWVGEIANIDGLAVMLVDTPGVRETADAIEHRAIERSQAEVSRADLVVVVLDATQPLSATQERMRESQASALVVINKVDAPAAWDIQKVHAVHTAASSGLGVDTLRQAIRQHFGCGEMDVEWPRIWTPRQREIVSRAMTDAATIAEI